MALTLTDRPSPSEYADYYDSYIRRVPDGDVLAYLHRQLEEWQSYFRTVPEEMAPRVHPPYTWSVAQVVGHLADSERVFGYRAMRIARADQTPLPGFEENAYAQNGGFDQCKLADLVDELTQSRRANLAFFHNMSAGAWIRTGTANNYSVSVRAIPYIIAGHVLHHLEILKRRLGAG